MKKLQVNVDWQSKFIDLLIVIVGISIAFKLNNWNESIRSEQDSENYIRLFIEENKSNEDDLIAALEFSRSNAANMDTLKQLLTSGAYGDPRIKIFLGGMMGLSNFEPSTTTMENITASGEFELITNNTLRNKIVFTYNQYETVNLLEQYLIEYVNKYATPYFFDNIRFSDFTPLNNSFISDPRFENIVIGYDVLLQQQISGYEECRKRIVDLKATLVNTPLK